MAAETVALVMLAAVLAAAGSAAEHRARQEGRTMSDVDQELLFDDRESLKTHVESLRNWVRELEAGRKMDEETIAHLTEELRAAQATVRQVFLLAAERLVDDVPEAAGSFLSFCVDIGESKNGEWPDTGKWPAPGTL